MNHFSVFGGMAFALLILGVLAILAKVMIMLAVGEDCKTIGVKNRTLWMLLAFFIPITALIYLVVRSSLEKTVPKFCPRCGATSAPNMHFCQNCGNTALMDYQITDAPVHQKKRKSFLTWGIILYVVYFVVYLVAVGSVFVTGTRNLFGNYQNGGNGGGIYDFNPDFGNDYDDFFDEFNNFGNGN